MKILPSRMTADRATRNKPIYRRIWFWAGLGVGGGILASIYGVSVIDSSLPDKAELNAVVREQTLTIKAADGTILKQQGEASREQLKLEQIPDNLKKAFIASEDRRFEQHKGIDAQGILRAGLNNLRSQGVVEGGSTITQQLARILFLKQEQTIWRKLKEIRLAQKIESELTKDQILERYLNLVYLGAGAYGVADASWVYFSKSPDQLSLAEMATIAGLAPAPSLYAPDKNPVAAKQRRNLVLQRMQEEKFITPEQRRAATQEALTLKTSLPKRLQVESPYFTTYVQKELPKYVSADVLSNGGLVVETTLNPTWQKAAEEAVAKTLRNQGRWENFKEAAMVAIDPRNGEIKAMVGGKDFGKNQFNRVTQAQRQPGSTFKGFVYATAIASGKSPYATYQDAPFVVDGYEPKNYSESFRGSMTMRDALTRSTNIVAVKVLIDIGFTPTIKLAHDMGIKSELRPTYSLALGSNEVNLLELTSAYGSFATQGLHTEPHGITRILNRQGKVIWSADFKSKRVLDADSAAIMTWMLRNVVEAGTGGAAQLGNRPVAGKTGTSDEARDLWFIGYIPQVVTGVWLGNDNNRPTYGSSSSAAYTWHEFMEKAVEGMPVEKFPKRPKLEGRKGTIKAQSIKPKQVLNRSISSNDDESEQQSYRNSEDNSGSSRRRRSRRYSQEEQQSTSDYTPRRRRRYRSTEESTTSNSSSESSRPRRRYRRVESSDSPPPRRTRRSSSPSNSSGSSGSSSSQPSWRDRLRPTQE
ncbi:penicillin-binding protein [Nostoc linckia z18]|uniref:Penicillin-binding protein n=2 Tax=Nostoc linckia TaxID=92942 RepID=A0A9Q5Z8W6_NOSLI|nr:penicillin-binding protein 1A [Nostoc linckia]PHK41783.1 penicillin-binding protein [Nostoc linckia z15]PHK45852.1 penicillin-binding protein [Nostoc linckia z16]PHJ69066.1 penicillin-binding protein [Nostoc linckia z1]PHJ73217.1 penicillin-binding protein [Nostoc linckia z3]PHJ78564.1 penicillin-binding protein [Nostoc linckia z2]